MIQLCIESLKASQTFSGVRVDMDVTRSFCPHPYIECRSVNSSWETGFCVLVKDWVRNSVVEGLKASCFLLFFFLHHHDWVGGPFSSPWSEKSRELPPIAFPSFPLPSLPPFPPTQPLLFLSFFFFFVAPFLTPFTSIHRPLSHPLPFSLSPFSLFPAFPHPPLWACLSNLPASPSLPPLHFRRSLCPLCFPIISLLTLLLPSLTPPPCLSLSLLLLPAPSPTTTSSSHTRPPPSLISLAPSVPPLPPFLPPPPTPLLPLQTYCRGCCWLNRRRHSVMVLRGREEKKGGRQNIGRLT